MHIVLQIVLGLFILGVLVVIHELGHFVVAKAFKVHVLAFSIGFGKALFTKTIGETEYRLSAVPFGGYIHMAGEHPEDEHGVEPGDFNEKPIWQRALVGIAGPVANIVFAVVCLWVMFVIGVAKPQYMMYPVVGSVVKTSAAQQAGFMPGDSIVSINAKPVASWTDVQKSLTPQAQPVIVVVVRQAKLDTISFTVPKITGRGLPKYPSAGLLPAFPAVVGGVNSGTPAQIAGLQPKDTIIAINGQKIYSWYQLTEQVGIYDTASGPLTFVARHNGVERTLSITPAYNATLKRYQVGVSAATPSSVTIKYSPLQAVSGTLEKTWEYTAMIFNVLGQIIDKQVSPKQLAGPVGIIQMSGVIAMGGFSSMLDFMALIGINLGILNLMPLVITDGGLLLFLLIEAIRRKPLSLVTQSWINRIAITFFIALFIFVTVNDIGRIPELLRLGR
jgi:regulator of sigma E protease